jgi:hypothetical protein
MADTWITDDDTHALVADTDAPAWRKQGWADAAEPPPDGWVFMWREGIAQPGRAPASALRDLWGPQGWVVGPPPGGVHPLTPKPAADPAASKPKPAARGLN